MNEQDLKQFFQDNKSDVADNGFSAQVARRLPERTRIFPQLVMFVCIATGILLAGMMVGFAKIEMQLFALLNAVTHFQLPSLSSVMTYFSVLLTMGFVGFVVADRDVK
jgi:hypothetical protein